MTKYKFEAPKHQKMREKEALEELASQPLPASNSHAANEGAAFQQGLKMQGAPGSRFKQRGEPACLDLAVR